MLGALAVLVVALITDFSAAQNSTSGPPPCTVSSLDWATNSLGQSPCAVTVALGGACANGMFRLPALGTNQVYLAPNATNFTPCRCSSVYYSTLSACSACQGADYLAWSTYKAACPVVYTQVFPTTIPPAINVPHWAYLDVSQGDTFNQAAASAAGGPESTAPPAASQTTPPGSSQTSQTNQSSGGGGVNAGAIAGGVIGGIAFLAFVAGAVFWILRKQRLAKRAQPSSGYDNMSYAPSTFVTTAIPTPKPYDPNDPSTFPTNDSTYGAPYAATPPPGSQHHGVTSNFTGSTLHTTPYTPARPQYTGAPEL